MVRSLSWISMEYVLNGSIRFFSRLQSRIGNKFVETFVMWFFWLLRLSYDDLKML